MDVVEKRGNLVMDKDKAIFIAAELIAELKSRLHRKKTTKQEQIIKSKISKIRITRKKLNASNNAIQVKKCIAIIFNYFDKYLNKISDVTIDELVGLALKNIRPENAVIMVVGDKEKILPQLKNLKFGEVTEVGIFGQEL
ncbi:MAG: hypothetical protein IIB07_01235 [Bacteroidetes bacterium]|nr:hypothetical protein [Bacteroidota bacterium]